MLGYVKVDKGELKVREYEVYSGYYCGICKSIGRRYGQLPRMALSYDAAFLAVLLASLDSTPDRPQQEHCIASPIKKKTIIRNQAIDYAGDVMLLLAWYKLLDDAQDEGRKSAKAATLLLKHIYQKLRRKYSRLCEKMETHLAELRRLEEAKCDSIDMAAEAFSKIMEDIFAEGIRTVYGNGNMASGTESCCEKDTGDTGPCRLQNDLRTPDDALASIGYHLGKWIYLIDAVDDIEENIESGAYNPLLYRFGYDSDNETPAEFRTRIEERLRFNLFHYLAVISNCASALDIQKNQGIIENIIYFGLNRKTEEIIKGETDESI